MEAIAAEKKKKSAKAEKYLWKREDNDTEIAKYVSCTGINEKIWNDYGWYFFFFFSSQKAQRMSCPILRKSFCVSPSAGAICLQRKSVALHDEVSLVNADIY